MKFFLISLVTSEALRKFVPLPLRQRLKGDDRALDQSMSEGQSYEDNGAARAQNGLVPELKKLLLGESDSNDESATNDPSNGANPNEKGQGNPKGQAHGPTVINIFSDKPGNPSPPMSSPPQAPPSPPSSAPTPTPAPQTNFQSVFQPVFQPAVVPFGVPSPFFARPAFAARFF